jgi:2-polyprenyl-3-methyl-5-hydroxy-6-metoxy-1,4-benzoquinol methylase
MEARKDFQMMDDRLVRHPLGFWRVKDIPDEAALKEYYERQYFQTGQSNYRTSYPDAELEWFDIKTARVACAVSKVRETEAMGTLLDVGCGEGFSMSWFQRLGWSVKGLDYSRAGMTNMNPHLLDRLETGDIQKLIQEKIADNEKYDLLWLTNVLEHVIDPIALLSQLEKLVAPGGALVVTVPNDASAWQEFLFEGSMIERRFWVAIPDHLSYFDASSLANVAQATGWHCAQVMADFPIDWFLGNSESNYVNNPSKGRSAHQARILVDSIMAKMSTDKVNEFYTSMASIGMGRQLTSIFTKKGNP